MTRDEFDAFCAGLPATTHVVQWGNTSVWKVGGKIFALCSSWGTGGVQAISFKCSEMSYGLLIEEAGIVPAPYLARARWVQIREKGALSDEDIRAYVVAAHGLILRKLPKTLKASLGLAPPQ